jgi:hypothetical protein
MEKYGFVYIWYDRYRKRFYIGCHWGAENDGYICSSSNMLKAYKRRPHDFKRRILKRIYTNKKDLLEEEYKWLLLIKDEELRVKYYNLHNHHFGHWTIKDMDSKRTTLQKMSEAAKLYQENNPGQLQRIHKEYFKDQKNRDKLSELKKEYYKKEENRKKVSIKTKEAMRRPDIRKRFLEGYKNRKFVSWNKGKTLSDEHKQKMRDAKKKQIMLKCPFCGVNGKGSGMKQWHFENCKYKELNFELLRIEYESGISFYKLEKKYNIGRHTISKRIKEISACQYN